MRPPSHKPVFDRLVVAENGHVWARHFEAMPRHQRTWLVFDADGRVVARVETPLGMRVAQIGEDYVLGVVTDDAGIAYVQQFKLERGGR